MPVALILQYKPDTLSSDLLHFFFALESVCNSFNVVTVTPFGYPDVTQEFFLQINNLSQSDTIWVTVIHAEITENKEFV